MLCRRPWVLAVLDAAAGVKITIPGLKPATALNGKSGSSNSATPEQRTRLSDYQRALRAEATWKAVSKLLGTIVVALVATIVIMAIQFKPRVVGWVEQSNGVQRYVGDAQQAVTPTENTIRASIVAYIRYLREIPGGDFRLVDRNTFIAHREMTVPGSPAEQDELAYWTTHNPKMQGRMTRVIVEKNPTPTCTRLGDTLTFTCVFGEQVRDSQGNLTTVARTGTITMKNEPVLPTDGDQVNDNAGGIDIWSISHSLVED
jgi:type IV secretory pathway TrbF-like protein